MQNTSFDIHCFPKLDIKLIDDETRTRFSELILSSGISEMAPELEVWTSPDSNKTLSYLSHGIFRYFGKFPPPIARYLIESYSNKKELILDPMCGSGTTALESLLLDRKAICLDINPLSVLITKVKTSFIPQNMYFLALNEVLERINNYQTDCDGFELPGFKNPQHWFLTESIASLSAIKDAIIKTEIGQCEKDALMVAFLSVVRRVSKATTQQGRLFLDIESAEKDAIPFFKKKAIDIGKQLALLPDNNNSVKINQQSILESDEIKEQAKLIICHPPYFNSYKYSSVNSLELAWLGTDHADVRKDEIREAFKIGKSERVVQYVEDMACALKNMYGGLQSDGRLALMIGDTVIKGQYIPVLKNLLDKLGAFYEVERAALRIPKFTEASWAASQRRTGQHVGINLCDLIVILRKKWNPQH